MARATGDGHPKDCVFCPICSDEAARYLDESFEERAIRVKADLFVNGIITAEGRTLQNATFRVSMPKPTDESLQEEANRRGVDVGGFAPDPYTIALRKQGKAAPVVFDANGVPDGYATALNKKKEK